MGKATTFNAGDYGRLRYDFTDYGGVTGIIPEPSDDLINEFQEDYRALARRYGVDIGDEAPAEEVTEAINKADQTDMRKAQAELAELSAKLCSNSPDADQILQIPFRIRMRFNAWLLGQIMDPEAAASATRPTGRAHGG